MTVWINSILSGVSIFLRLALPVFIPFSLCAALLRRRWNLIRILADQFFCFYLCCVFALVFLPLPTVEEAATLTVRLQSVPFFFLYDIVKHPDLSAVLGALFNILMTIPFGVFLAWMFGCREKQAVLLGLLLSLFIEFGQFTGLFFLFRGSYRVCDVDDLMMNTLGTFIGFRLTLRWGALLPELARFDKLIPIPSKKHRFV